MSTGIHPSTQLRGVRTSTSTLMHVAREPDPEPKWSIDPAMTALLEHMLKIDASDLYLTHERPPTFRVDGVGLAGKQPATAEQLDCMADSLMTPAQRTAG